MMQRGYCRYALLADLLWLAVERAISKNPSKMELDCLEHHRERSLKFYDRSSTQVNLLLLIGETGIVRFVVNVQVCGMHCY